MMRLAGLGLILTVILMAPPASSEILLLSLPDGSERPIVAAMMDGRPLRLLVDTGSSVSVLKSDVWRALGSPGRIVSDAWIGGAGGMAVTQIVKGLPPLELGSCRINVGEWYVFQLQTGMDGEGGLSGLIGTDVLKTVAPVVIGADMGVMMGPCG